MKEVSESLGRQDKKKNRIYLFKNVSKARSDVTHF